MIFEQFIVGSMQNFCYIFADKDTLEGFVVDPAFDPEQILNKIKQHKINLTRIILTHHHFDHINAATRVKASTGAKVCCHPQTVLQGEVDRDILLEDNDSFKVGEKTVKCFHTPGHAPGSICLQVDDKWLITGDTLFIGNCGRADLQDSNPEDLFTSLQRLKKLPDNLMVCSGHNYGAAKARTLAEEKAQNPALKAKNLDEFMRVP